MNTQIYQEACDWFVDFRSGDIDAEAQKHFDTWIRKSPEHLRAYLEITEIWQDAAGIDAMGERGELSVAQLVAAANRHEGNVFPLELRGGPEAADTLRPLKWLGAEGSGGGRFVAIGRRRVGFAVAATVLISCLLGTAVYLYSQRGVYTTGIGAQQSIALDDGTLIQLNSGTRLRVRYKPGERDIDLMHGQALFKVAKDHTRPFIVRVDGTNVRAVGTQFDVYRKEGGTVVTVVEGRVAVSRQARAQIEQRAPEARGPGTAAPEAAAPATVSAETSGKGEGLRVAPGEILLAAGEQLTVTPTAASKPEAADVSAVTSWTQRQLVFKGTPLSDVVTEFNRYNTRRLRVDGDFSGFRISGVYTSTDPALLLAFLRSQPGVQIEERADEIRIIQK